MTRDYTKPHPDAIFRDKPTYFIEVWKSPEGIKQAEGKIGWVKVELNTTEFHGHKTIALFIIKPKPNAL